MKIEKLFKENKFLFGFYFGMLLMQIFRTITEYGKEQIISLLSLITAIGICIVLLWLISNIQGKNKLYKEMK